MPATSRGTISDDLRNRLGLPANLLADMIQTKYHVSRSAAYKWATTGACPAWLITALEETAYRMALETDLKAAEAEIEHLKESGKQSILMIAGEFEELQTIEQLARRFDTLTTTFI